MKLKLLFGLSLIYTLTCFGKDSNLLRSVEDHYRSAKTVKMDVDKVLKLKLLEKEKHSKGTIQAQHGGNLRWDTTSPQHSLVLINPHAVWLVDFPEEEDQKVTVLKASRPKKSQPHAIVAFLLGQGHISDDFKVTQEKATSEGFVKVDLKPKSADDQIHWLSLFVNKSTKNIERLSFEDNVGNVTELRFQNIKFDQSFREGTFKFNPPKNSDITVID